MSTKRLRVAGVFIGDDAWVTKVVATFIITCCASVRTRALVYLPATRPRLLFQNHSGAELKLILKQDLGLDLDVPKSNCYVPGNHLDDDQARALFKVTLAH